MLHIIHFARWQHKRIIFCFEHSMGKEFKLWMCVCVKIPPNYYNCKRKKKNSNHLFCRVFFWLLLISLAFNHDRNCLITWLFKTFAHKFSTFHKGSKLVFSPFFFLVTILIFLCMLLLFIRLRECTLYKHLIHGRLWHFFPLLFSSRLYFVSLFHHGVLFSPLKCSIFMCVGLWLGIPVFFLDNLFISAKTLILFFLLFIVVVNGILLYYI